MSIIKFYPKIFLSWDNISKQWTISNLLIYVNAFLGTLLFFGWDSRIWTYKYGVKVRYVTYYIISHYGAIEGNRTPNPFLTKELRYRCATIAKYELWKMNIVLIDLRLTTITFNYIQSYGKQVWAIKASSYNFLPQLLKPNP